MAGADKEGVTGSSAAGTEGGEGNEGSSSGTDEAMTWTFVGQ